MVHPPFPLPCPPLAAPNPIHLHSTPSASILLQLQSILVQLMQLCHTHSQTNCRSILDPFRPSSHAKGHHLYRSEEHTSELQPPDHLVCRLLLDKKTIPDTTPTT